MEILLWLVPPFVCAVLAMIWVAWVSRSGRREVDHEESMRLIGAVLERQPQHAESLVTADRVRSTGVAVRRVGSE